MNFRPIIAGCLVVASVTAMTQAQPRLRRQPVPRQSMPRSQVVRRAVARPTVGQVVEASIRPWIQKQQPPGVIVVVRHAGKTQFFPFGMADQAKHRPVTPDSVFELASITKVFTTTSLAMEVEDGKMKLADPLAAYMPYLREHGGDIRLVTLRQLATHTSSLPRSPDGSPPDGRWRRGQLMDWLTEWHAPYPPGSKSLYSNLGVGMLGYAIENVEQKPLIEVWRQQFLDKLGMRQTFFEIPPQSAELVVQGYSPKGEAIAQAPLGAWPAGGRLCSSGRDMGEFVSANLGERPDLPKISKAMQLAQQPFFKASAKMTQGLAWQRVQLEGELVIDKNGGMRGTSTYIGMLPAHRVGIVVMANRGKCSATMIGRKLLLAMIGKQYGQ